MPEYRFEFREDFARETLDGLELANDEEARKEAVRAAREIMSDGILQGIDRTGWVARVYDEMGAVVTTLKFSDLVKKRGHLE